MLLSLFLSFFFFLFRSSFEFSYQYISERRERERERERDKKEEEDDDEITSRSRNSLDFQRSQSAEPPPDALEEGGFLGVLLALLGLVDIAVVELLGSRDPVEP